MTGVLPPVPVNHRCYVGPKSTVCIHTSLFNLYVLSWAGNAATSGFYFKTLLWAVRCAVQKQGTSSGWLFALGKYSAPLICFPPWLVWFPADLNSAKPQQSSSLPSLGFLSTSLKCVFCPKSGEELVAEEHSLPHSCFLGYPCAMLSESRPVPSSHRMGFLWDHWKAPWRIKGPGRGWMEVQW